MTRLLRLLAALAIGAVLGWFARMFTDGAARAIDDALYGIGTSEGSWYQQ